MKVLQVNVCLNTLSTGRITEQIGQSVIKEGWESYVLSFGPILNSQSKVLKNGGFVSRFVHRIANRFLDAQGYFSYFETKRNIKEIERIDPDIIHLHNIHDCWLNFPLLFKYIISHNKPVVWTFHDCWAFTGHCMYFDDANCSKWLDQCYNCPLCKSLSLDRSKANYLYKKHLFTKVRRMTIVPVSNWLNRLVKESYLKNYNIRTIHNGIDTELFQNTHGNLREKLCIENDFVVLGVASSWGQSKGLYDFAELSKDARFKIILVGVPDEIAKKLPSSIICISKTDSQTELAQYYSIADVFVNPTYHDNYPTVNLEALSCGTPVITYDTGGSPECITDETGKLYNPLLGSVIEKGNIEALRRTILQYSDESADLRNQRSIACREYALSHFDKYSCYETYISLYKDMLANP